MRILTTALVLMYLGGCTALMVGGDAATYPPAEDCPEGQARTENGCEAETDSE